MTWMRKRQEESDVEDTICGGVSAVDRVDCDGDQLEAVTR